MGICRNAALREPVARVATRNKQITDGYGLSNAWKHATCPAATLRARKNWNLRSFQKANAKTALERTTCNSLNAGRDLAGSTCNSNQFSRGTRLPI